ncbi:MAG: hypothetical protein DA408_08025 [Bacteroidetes bacterium]|nr:MAG: hypothetical protein DA408_08025 [Bacteroidota bacterium]
MNTLKIFSILALLFPALLFSQSRNEISLPKFNLDKYYVMNKADGWALNSSSKEWVKNENQVSDQEASFRLTHNAMNFDSMLVNEITIDDDTLTVLFIFKTGGKYRYPRIRKEWYEQRILKYIVFDSDGVQAIEEIIRQPMPTTRFVQAHTP